MSVEELIPKDPQMLLTSLVHSVDDNKYAVVTVLLDFFTYMISRGMEHEAQLEPEENPDGRFQTNVFSVVDGDNGPEIDMRDVLSVKRWHHGREAFQGHDEICRQLESEEFDYVKDPYYQHMQISKLKAELENIDLNSIEED